MITLDIEQGSNEWFQARLGIPTASVFDKIVTTTGAPSKSAEKLMYKLAGERIIGYAEEGYINEAMQRGIDLEEEARMLFQITTDMEVEKVGICFHDESRKFACSPDGKVGDNEGLEIKCPSLAVHVEYLLNNKLPATYFQQVQGSLFVTGWERYHFFSYYPGMRPFHIVVERDEIWIAKFSKAIKEFCDELEEVYNKLMKD